VCAFDEGFVESEKKVWKNGKNREKAKNGENWEMKKKWVKEIFRKKAKFNFYICYFF
jgi:hypothetical protein